MRGIERDSYLVSDGKYCSIPKFAGVEEFFPPQNVWTGRFPSGQRGQTVNLLAQPSEVRILPSPFLVTMEDCAGIAQLARASAFQAEGRGFESRFPLHSYAEGELASGGQRFLVWVQVFLLNLHLVCWSD